MGCEGVQERLEGVVEDNLIILPRMNWSQLHRLVGRGRDRTLTLHPRMKFEMVVERYLFLAGLWNEGYSNLDFELSPSGFRNLERRLVDIWMTVNRHFLVFCFLGITSKTARWDSVFLTYFERRFGTCREV